MPGVEVVGMEQRDQYDDSRSIDIVACYKDQLLAVEVDGPQHFTWPGQHPTGDTLVRKRALVRRGYRVVCVPVNPGWDQQRGKQQQQQYLRELLDAAVSEPPSPMA
jgi:very-short-patch-repair endonuclease